MAEQAADNLLFQRELGRAQGTSASSEAVSNHVQEGGGLFRPPDAPSNVGVERRQVVLRRQRVGFEDDNSSRPLLQPNFLNEADRLFRVLRTGTSDNTQATPVWT